MKVLYTILFICLILTGCPSNPEGKIDHKEFKDELIEIGHRCYERELFWGTGGDISVRIPESDQFIIKATMNCVGDLDYSKLATVNFDCKHLSGANPSHETPIHAEIYKLRDDIGAILHMHAPYATAWATVGLKIPALTQQSVTLLKNSATVPYYPVGSSELVESVVACYKNPETNVVFMENHGVFVIGKDLSDLLYNAEKLENTAKIAYLCKALGESKSFKHVSVY